MGTNKQTTRSKKSKNQIKIYWLATKKIRIHDNNNKNQSPRKELFTHSLIT